MFDGATNMLKLLVTGEEEMTGKQIKKAKAQLKRKQQEQEKDSDLQRARDETQSKRRRDHNSRKPSGWVDKCKFNNKRSISNKSHARAINI